MTQELLKRSLGRDDWEEFRNLRLHALKSHPSVYGSSYARESLRSDVEWQDILESKTMRVFGAFNDKALVGLAAAYDWLSDETGKSACLGMWYMTPEFRKSSEFTDLVKLTIAWASAQNKYDRIVVSHREGNESSKAVNQRLGFEYFMTRADRWPDGPTADNYFYELRITK